MKIQTVNVDDLTPERLLDEKRRHAVLEPSERRGAFRHARVSVGDHSCINVERLFDWRALERRCFELMLKSRVHEANFWHILKDLCAQGSVKGATQVWLCTKGSNVFVYEGKSGYGNWTDIEHLIGVSASKTDRDAIVIEPNDAAPILREKERARTFRLRGYAYDRAWKFAVEDRLQPLTSAWVLEKTNSTFSITVDDRQYDLVINEKGHLSSVPARTTYVCK